MTGATRVVFRQQLDNCSLWDVISSPTTKESILSFWILLSNDTLKLFQSNVSTEESGKVENLACSASIKLQKSCPGCVCIGHNPQRDVLLVVVTESHDDIAIFVLPPLEEQAHELVLERRAFTMALEGTKVVSMAVNADATMLAVGCQDCRVLIYRIPSFSSADLLVKPLVMYEARDTSIPTQVTFLPTVAGPDADNCGLVTGRSDGSLDVLLLQGNTDQRQGFPIPRVAVDLGNGLDQVANETGHVIANEHIDFHCSPVTAVSCTPDGTMVIFGCENGDISLWDTSKLPMLVLVGHVRSAHFGTVHSLTCISKSVFASTGSDRCVSAWHIEEPYRPFHTFRTEQFLCGSCMAFSLDGALVVSGALDGRIECFYIEGGHETKET